MPVAGYRDVAGATPRQADESKFFSAGNQSELPHQSSFIKPAPSLDDGVVFDPEHLHAFKD